MPITKSMSRDEIIRKEIKSGKPRKQAVAIGYSYRPAKETVMSRRKK